MMGRTREHAASGKTVADLQWPKKIVRKVQKKRLIAKLPPHALSKFKKYTASKPTTRSESKKRSGASTTANKKAAEVTATVEDLTPYPQDVDAFSSPFEPETDIDHISRLPPECLSNVFSYCLLHHEPELGKRRHEEGSDCVPLPHVLLSLAAMSTYFRGNVEAFCRHELLANKAAYKYKTPAEAQAGRRRQPTRSSARLSTVPKVDNTVHRMELVGKLRSMCVKCSKRTWGWSGFGSYVMCNGVAFCYLCKMSRYLDIMVWSLHDTQLHYDS